MDRKKCLQPWFEMQIKHDENVGFCCYYHDNVSNYDFTVPFDVEKYWNNELMQEVRGILLSNQLKDTGCEGCQFLEYNYNSTFLEIPSELNEIQKENWNNALSNYNEKKTIVDSFPVKYYLSFGLMCNIRCIMCSQKELRKKDKNTLPIEPLLAMKEYFLKANEIAIIGGEPLFIPNSKKFIKAIVSDPDYSNIRLSIYTNAVLLHEFIDSFKSMKRISVTVSLDSIEEAYESIRRGASWKQVENNILSFKKVATEEQLDWSISITGVIMKSSIPRLDDFVEWCVKNDLKVNFVPIVCCKIGDPEDTFNNPFLLDDIPEWEEIFDRAIDKLNENGQNGSQLSFIKNKLKQKYENCLKYDSRFRSKGHLCLSENFMNFISDDLEKKVILFGASIAGETAYKYIQKLNESPDFNINIKAFFDNDESKWGKKFNGIKIYKPSKDIIDTADKILITSMYAKEIRKQLLDLGAKDENIIIPFIDEFVDII